MVAVRRTSPTEDELTEFTDGLATLRNLPKGVHAIIGSGAREDAPAMDVLRVALAAGQLGIDDDPLETPQRGLAICPTIVATYWRRRQGLEPIQSQQDRSKAANFLYMLSGIETTDVTVKELEIYLTTIVEDRKVGNTMTYRTNWDSPLTQTLEAPLDFAATTQCGYLEENIKLTVERTGS